MLNASSLSQITLFTIFLLMSGTTVAQDSNQASDAIRPIVVIVSLEECCEKEAWSEAEEKIRLEFLQAGLEVETVSGQAMTEAERRAELIKIAAEYEAAAAIRILKPAAVESKAGVDLWITDRVTQKTVYRFLPLDDVQSGESSIVAALKTMELFKGSLQEINIAKEKKKKLPDSIEEISRSPKLTPPRKKFRLAGGFGGIFFARDVGFRGAPMFWLGWSPIKQFVLQLEGVFGVIGRDVVSDGNASRIFFNSLILKPMWVMATSEIVRPAIGLMVGSAFVQMEGVRSNFLELKTEKLTALLLGVGIQMSFSLTEALWLTPAFDIGFMTPQARVLFHDEEVARFGIPILRLSLLLNVHF